MAGSGALWKAAKTAKKAPYGKTLTLTVPGAATVAGPAEFMGAVVATMATAFLAGFRLRAGMAPTPYLTGRVLHPAFAGWPAGSEGREAIGGMPTMALGALGG